MSLFAVVGSMIRTVLPVLVFIWDDRLYVTCDRRQEHMYMYGSLYRQVRIQPLHVHLRCSRSASCPVLST